MNRFERTIHDSVGKYPFIRIPLVALYQRIFSIIPTINYEYSPLIANLPGYFFGFHDKCPWSGDGLKLLAHRFSTKQKMRQVEKHPIEVGYFRGSDFGEYSVVGTTQAWNWQQGSNLQWLGRSDKLIYNDVSRTENVSRIYDICSDSYETIPCHTMAVSHDGRYTLHASFERLGKGMLGYGYKTKHHTDRIDDNLPNEEGLCITDLTSKNITKIINLVDLAAFESNKYMEEAYHFITHCLFSPNSKRFVFFHRYLLKNGVLTTRMYSSDISGNSIWKFPCEGFSHIAWAGDTSVIAYCKPPRKIAGFYIIEEFTGKITELANNLLTSDGHPQVSSDGKYILVDTYPDRYRHQKLMIYDLENRRSDLLIRYKIPFKYRYERRCDFHPRWSRDGDLICFDSAHKNIRSLCVMRKPTFP